MYYNKIMISHAATIIISAVFLTVIIFTFAVVLKFSMNKKDAGINTIKIGNASLSAEFAVTNAERQKGLSGRDSLMPGGGLLFVFGEPGRYPFWMKDMKFPIDIIWIAENKKVADISANISPATYPQNFFPRSPVKYVLEVNAFWAENNKIKLDDDLRGSPY